MMEEESMTDQSYFNRNSDCVVIPGPQGHVVVPETDTPPMTFLNAHTPGERVRVSPTDSGLFNVETRYSPTEEWDAIGRDEHLLPAIAKAADVEGFEITAGGEPYSVMDAMVGDEHRTDIRIDTGQFGGLLIEDVAQLPVTIGLDLRECIEYRVRHGVDESEHAGDWFVFEQRQGADSWREFDSITEPTQPAVAFAELASQTDVPIWTPDFEVDLATQAQTVTQMQAVHK